MVGSTDMVVVAGPMSDASSRTVQDRFEHVRVTVSPARTVTDGPIRNQSALRALLTQVWDAGAIATRRSLNGHE
jgi:hypothetical protein